MAQDSGALRGGNEAKLMNQPITAVACFGSEKAAFSVAWADLRLISGRRGRRNAESDHGATVVWLELSGPEFRNPHGDVGPYNGPPQPRIVRPIDWVRGNRGRDLRRRRDGPRGRHSRPATGQARSHHRILKKQNCPGKIAGRGGVDPTARKANLSEV